MRKFALWLVWNIPLGRLGPYVMGYAVGSAPILQEQDATKAHDKGCE